MAEMNNLIKDAINNLFPGNSLYEIGTLLMQAMNQRNIRPLEYVRYVDANVVESGDGKSWDGAFKTITEGVADVNTLSGKGATLLIRQGFYMEVPPITVSAYDVLIQAVGLPEDTVLFGTGTAGVIAASADDLLKITGGNVHVDGLGLYNHKDDKACIVFDDTGGGYHGSFNKITRCYFSPQTQDGVGYGIKYSGGNVNYIFGNMFYGAKESAILLTGNVGNPTRNIIKGNHFVGTNIGVHITSANYNTLIADNWFSVGSQPNENMTNGVTIAAGMNAGKVTIMRNMFEQSAVNDVDDSKTGSAALIEMDNTNAA